MRSRSSGEKYSISILPALGLADDADARADVLLQALFQVGEDGLARRGGGLALACAGLVPARIDSTRRSVARTVRFSLRMRSAARSCSSARSRPSSTLAWPTLRSFEPIHARICSGSVEQPHGVRDGDPALPDLLRDLFLRQRKFLHQPRVGLGFLDRAQVGALEIFDQRQLEHVAVARLAHDDGQRFESRLARRAPAAFACDQFVLATDQPDDERLDDAPFLDRIDQLGEFLGAERFARLERARDDVRRAKPAGWSRPFPSPVRAPRVCSRCP